MEQKFIYSVCVALTIKNQNNLPSTLIFENEDKARECFETFKDNFKAKHWKDVRIIVDNEFFFTVYGTDNLIRMDITLSTHEFCDSESYLSHFGNGYDTTYEAVIESPIQPKKSMTFYTINGKDYLVRNALCHATRNVELFGTTELSNDLFDEDGNPKQDNSLSVDESFYGYVPEDVMRDLSDEDFEKYINENFDWKVSRLGISL